MKNNPVCVSTWPETGGHKYFASFLETARRHGIEPVNADGATWAGDSWQTKEWFRKSMAQARFVRENAERYTHFLFCDAHDVLFAAGWDEILPKYEALALGLPVVFAAECYPWPKPEQAPLYEERNAECGARSELRCKYLNAGFWMAETGAALKLAETLENRALKREQCDQGIAVDMYLSGAHPIRLDHTCALCHCCNLDSLSFLELKDGRWRNTETGEFPCTFHGNANADMMGILQGMK